MEDRVVKILFKDDYFFNLCGFLPDLLWYISVMTFILVGGWRGLTRLKGHYHTSKDSPRLIWNNTSESKDKKIVIAYIYSKTHGWSPCKFILRATVTASELNKSIFNMNWAVTTL